MQTPNGGCCPVCKGDISLEKIIPIYGYDTVQKDPRISIPGRPKRPRRERNY
ncbi:MAG: hypothetical protein MHPSP_003200, partial [Paramarteilia canceri]